MAAVGVRTGGFPPVEPGLCQAAAPAAAARIAGELPPPLRRAGGERSRRTGEEMGGGGGSPITGGCRCTGEGGDSGLWPRLPALR